MEYTRITLRIPTDLHEELIEASNAKSCSMNAEIIYRLRLAGERKFAFSENINELGDFEGLTEAQRKEVLEIVQAELERRAK